MRSPVWNLVLAAGAGRRLSPLTGGTPKQFWRPRGCTCLLDDTIERLKAVAPCERTVTVVDASHRSFVDAGADRGRWGHVLYQPQDRGTAAGVLLGLTAIVAADPDAIVVMSPSDHGVENATALRTGLRQGVAAIRRGEASTVLFGVEPNRPHGDYGWIMPAAPKPGSSAPRRVASFVEKPPPPEAERLLAAGAVWNTMVLAAPAGRLLDLYASHLPALYRMFVGAVAGASGAGTPVRALVDYRDVPVFDFSRDLLTPARDLSLMVWPSSMGWSDLGTPERLLEWHARRDALAARPLATSAA